MAQNITKYQYSILTDMYFIFARNTFPYYLYPVSSDVDGYRLLLL